MDETLQFKKIQVLRNLLRLSLAIGAMAITSFLFVLFLLLANIISFNPNSYLVVFNLAEESININDYKLEVFDVFVGETNVPRTYRINSSINNLKIEKTIPELDFPKLYLLTNSEIPQCFFSADVTSFYYEIDSEDVILSDVNILNSDGSFFIEYKLDYDSFVYVFPGRYSSANLPVSLVDKRVIGIYPVSCDKLENNDELKNLVLFYKSFNSEDQREFFYSQIEPLKQELGK